MEDHSHGEGGHACCTPKPLGSLQQSLLEMDFERGIWSAALDGDEDRVRKMLSQGTDPNSVDSSGYTALLYAARSGHLGTCEELLRRGARVNQATRSGGATALHRASYTGHTNIVDLLLKSGADPTICDSDGQNCLHKGAERGHLDVINFLVSEAPELKTTKDIRGRHPSDLYNGNDPATLSMLKIA